MMNRKERKHVVNEIDKQIHVGNMLSSFFKKRRIYKSALARKLNRRYETVFDYQKKSTIQVAILWEICNVLKHNFFNDIAALLPPDYTTLAAIDDTQTLEIADLKEQLKQVTAERDVLMKVVGK